MKNDFSKEDYMKKKEKIIMTLALIFTLSFALPFAANAMHIMAL